MNQNMKTMKENNSFIEAIQSRCVGDCYPVKFYLKSGTVIICDTDSVVFYDDHFEINSDGHGLKKTTKLETPDGVYGGFSHRNLWIPYSQIVMFSDAAS